ncbi:hypothetical protein [Melittangium boletus]|uniref:hypothetical protein n=1 Tax=Melittangium boletus TaxID=83453 RepID=UPI003DA2A131
MPIPAIKTCAVCGRAIAPDALYYRFALTLQAEQDVLGGGAGTPGAESPEEELTALLKRLEDSPDSAEAWEEQVHWERGGTVCTACRTVVVRLLTPPPGPERPH